MNPRGISIAGLLGIVLLVGMALGAIRQPTVIWTTLASTVVLVLLLVAIVGAIYRHGADRAYWFGFALFGWVYVALANGNWIGGQFGHDLTSGLDEIAGGLLTDPKEGPALNRPGAMELLAQQSIRRGNLVQIVRLLIALLFALAGGLIARAFAIQEGRTGRETTAQLPETRPRS